MASSFKFQPFPRSQPSTLKHSFPLGSLAPPHHATAARSKRAKLEIFGERRYRTTPHKAWRGQRFSRLHERMASRFQGSRPGDLKRRVGSVVRTLRKARELSQEALAERAGIGPRHLQKIEAGDSNLTLLTLSKLANGLTVEPAILLTGGRATPSQEPPGGKT